MMNVTSFKAIESVIQDYFDGIYEGNTEKLAHVFQKDGYLYGDIKGDAYLKHVSEYIEGVKNRQSPKELDDAYHTEILGIEVLGKIAMAKLRLQMLGFNYYDYLSLAKIDGDWKIVNKVFAHVE